MEDHSSQYVYFGLQLAWASSLNILTTYMVWRSKKDSTNVCFLDCESLNELQHAIHLFNTSAGICIQIRFYTWKQNLLLFPYLFRACFCFCSFISYVTDPATWTSSYLWDPSLSKQTFVVCAWISVWGEGGMKEWLSYCCYGSSPCAPLGWFGLYFWLNRKI